MTGRKALLTLAVVLSACATATRGPSAGPVEESTYTDPVFRQIASDDLITAVEWSPDERSLAVVAVVVKESERPKPVQIRVVDLASGRSRTVARVENPLTTPHVDILGFKILSWTK